MSLIKLLISSCFIAAITLAAPNINQNHEVRELHPDAGLNISEFLTKYGYPFESHEVQTEDGYILTLHRVPHGVTDLPTENRPAVLLMHGLFSSSIDFLNLGPGKSIGLQLADAGYDVWLGNQRGNTWSRRHVTIDPDTENAEFYNFSFHEVGVYDLPAKIDYILQTTGEQGVFYIGHSQGCTDFFIMASERPEYNDKIRLMSALAPAVFMGNMPNLIIRALAENLEFFQNLSAAWNIHEVLPHYGVIEEIGDFLCSNDSSVQDLCALFLDIIVGFDDLLDPDFIPVITSNAPAGASINQIFHYGQEYVSKRFRQYDWGVDGNLEKYGQEAPPDYDVTQVTAPVSLHYAANDLLVAVEDVAILNGLLPNVVSSREVPWEAFNHLDFIWAANVDTLLNNDVIAEIQSRT